MNCIHLGVIKSGHQQPPNGASTSDVIKAIELALRCVLAIVASIMANADDMTTMSIDRTITAIRECPRLMLKTKIPIVQNIVISTSPLAAVPVNRPAMIDSLFTEVASNLSRVRFCRSRTMVSAEKAAAMNTNITR